jgi:hypothetical protein
MELGLAKVKSSYSEKARQMARYAGRARTLYIGNSQMLKGLCPDSSSYNLANVSQCLYEDSALLALWLRYDSALRTEEVVLGISPWELGISLEKAEPWRQYFYYRYFGLDFRGRHFTDLSNYSLMALYTPRLSLQLAGEGFPDISPGLLPNGFQPEGSCHAPTEKDCQAREQVFLQEFDTTAIRVNARIVSGIAALCAKRNVRLALVQMPISSTMRAKQQARPPALRRLIETPWNEVIQSRGLLCLDASASMADSLFADPDHLCPAGARRLSAWLTQSLFRLTKNYIEKGTKQPILLGMDTTFHVKNLSMYQNSISIIKPPVEE